MCAGNVKIGVLFALVLLTASIAAAQPREGFWIGLGSGFGSAAISCAECDGEREGSGVGSITAGWTANSRLLIGAELNLWRKSQAIEDGVQMALNLYNVLGTARFYPSPSSGFFVKGGAGLAVVDAEVALEGTRLTVDLGKGVSLLGGAGYDIRLGRAISLTPAVNVWYARLGDLTIVGETLAERWRHNVVDFTIGITFH